MAPEATTPEVPLQVPRVGADVAFVLAHGQSAGEIRPAKVVQVFQGGLVNLQVFVDGSNDGYQAPAGLVWMTSIAYSSKQVPGSWHWPDNH